MRRQIARASDKHRHCLLQACLAQLDVSKGEQCLAYTVSRHRFIIKLSFLLFFWPQVLKNVAEKNDLDYELWSRALVIPRSDVIYVSVL